MICGRLAFRLLASTVDDDGVTLRTWLQKVSRSQSHQSGHILWDVCFPNNYLAGASSSSVICTDIFDDYRILVVDRNTTLHIVGRSGDIQGAQMCGNRSGMCRN